MHYRLLFKNLIFLLIAILLSLCSIHNDNNLYLTNICNFSYGETIDESPMLLNFSDVGFVNDELLNIKREEAILRTIVYPDDESNSFSNAELITLNTNVSRMYNDLSDFDYYFIGTLSTDKTLICDCDIPSHLSIYQYYSIIDDNGLHNYINKVMSYSNVSTINKIYLMAGFYYYFVFTQYGNYTGEYNFELDEVNLDLDKYIMKINYLSSGLFDKYELLYYNYSNYNTQGIRYGYVPAIADIGIPNLGDASTNYHCYFDNSSTICQGIFDESWQYSNDINDDDRLFTDFNYYPGQCVVYLESTYSTNVITKSRSTAFLVGDNVAMTAAHCIINRNLPRNYPTNVNLYCNAYVDSTNSFDYSDSLLVESAFIPMSFLENRDTGSMQMYSENDWAYIKYANSTEEKYGYFGMEYNDSYQMSLTCMGYPVLVYPINFNYEYRIRLIYSSDVFTTFYNSFRSNIDVSSGNSGGPCFYENQGIYIVRAITSSGDDYFNYFCKINKKNFNYLGVIS